MAEQNNTEETQSAFAFRLANSIEAFMDHHNGDLKNRYIQIQANVLDFHQKLRQLSDAEKNQEEYPELFKNSTAHKVTASYQDMLAIFNEHFQIETKAEGHVS